MNLCVYFLLSNKMSHCSSLVGLLFQNERQQNKLDGPAEQKIYSFLLIQVPSSISYIWNREFVPWLLWTGRGLYGRRLTTVAANQLSYGLLVRKYWWVNYAGPSPSPPFLVLTKLDIVEAYNFVPWSFPCIPRQGQSLPITATNLFSVELFPPFRSLSQWSNCVTMTRCMYCYC